MKRVPLTGLALAVAAVVAGAGPVTAAQLSQDIPEYRCARLVQGAQQGTWEGWLSCGVRIVARPNGPITGTFTITALLPPNNTVTCTPPPGQTVSGQADMPLRVVGFHCA